MTQARGNPTRGIIIGATAGVIMTAVVFAFLWFIDWALNRLAAADDGLSDPPDYLARVKHLTLAEAREQAEAILPERFRLKPAKKPVDLMGLPGAVKSLFERYSYIQPDHTFSWLDSGLLQWASWDSMLCIIGTDRDGLVIATRPGSETVYEVDREYDDPEDPDHKRMHPKTAAEYPSIYHWLLANVWDEPEDEATGFGNSQPG